MLIHERKSAQELGASESAFTYRQKPYAHDSRTKQDKLRRQDLVPVAPLYLYLVQVCFDIIAHKGRQRVVIYSGSGAVELRPP